MKSFIRKLPIGLLSLGFLGNACNPKETSHVEPFKNDDFEIIMGSAWLTDHNEDSFGWQNPETMEEVRVSVLRPYQIFDVDQMEKSALEYVAIRRQGASDYSEDTATLSETVRRERSDGFDMQYQGEDPKSRVMFCNIIRANSRRIISFAYNKYEPLFSKHEFEKRCNELASSWVVH